jgi:hypothetical protein
MSRLPVRPCANRWKLGFAARTQLKIDLAQGGLGIFCCILKWEEIEATLVKLGEYTSVYF